MQTHILMGLTGTYWGRRISFRAMCLDVRGSWP